MLNNKKTRTGWNSKSKFNIEYDGKTDRIKKVNGVYFINGMNVVYALSPGKSSGYDLRGTAKLINQDTGKILKRLEKDGKAKAAKAAIYISATHTKKTSDKKGISNKREEIIKRIKDAVEKKAQLLYGTFIEAIMAQDLSSEQNCMQNITYIFTKYKDEWVNTTKRIRSQNDKASDCAIRLMTRYFACLDFRPFNDISYEDTVKIRNGFGEKAARAEALAADFIDFCHERGYLPCDFCNPYSNIYPVLKAKRTTSQTQLLALETNQEAQLIKIIRARHYDSPLYIGVGFVLYSGLSSEQAMLLTWSDIIFDSQRYDFVRIKIAKNESSGATHNYTRPIFPVFAELLHKYYDYLICEGETVKELSAKPIIFKKALKSKRGKIKHNNSYERVDLTALCRRIMPEIAVSYQNIDMAKGDKNTGAGVNILLATYRTKLAITCGLEKVDPGAFSYLLSNSLSKSVTNDHYRSFSSAEGQLFLYRYMRRDTCFLPEPPKQKVVQTANDDGTVNYFIYPQTANHAAACDIEIILKPGESLTLSCESGFSGTYTATIKANAK